MLKFKNGALDLVTIGKENLRQVKRNYSKAKLYEEIIQNREGQITHGGALVVRTGHAHERSHTDRFIVKDSISEKKVCWGPRINELEPSYYETFLNRALSYMQNKNVYVQNCHVCSESNYSIPIRIVTETAWHSLFVRNMFFPIYNQQEPEKYDPTFTVIHIPSFQSIPEIDGTNSQTAVIVNMTHKVVIICGSAYSGNIRQAVFTMINYLIPDNVFPMRSAASMSFSGDIALFMGREGTGKTTLAIDSQSIFIGDHSHGWGADGIFNFENGIYAKVFGTTAEDSPEIDNCIRNFGTLLENVSIHLESRDIDLSDGDLTTNTRASFANKLLPNVSRKKSYGHPKNLFLLTCDAFGVLPPIARLSPEQAMFGFLSSFTSEFITSATGDVKPSFNVCFGDSSLTYPPHVYAERLRDKIKEHGVSCWLINTGWSGKKYGEADRFPLKYSRAAVRAVMSGELENVDYETDPVFQFSIPTLCPGIPKEMLNPRVHTDNIGEYELRANRLVAEFLKDFSQFEDQIPEDMKGLFSNILPVEDQIDFSDLGFSM
ncbi:MAG: phosphoenolpyruvate carboxykinase (ATP) [Candidatus Magnetomorum sp.]|nr:phosphoenolpyruvate carboxykinase (ATP) [Candidatus Magnetomorum sp.]